MKIIAISGGNSTGKSLFANYLVKRLGSAQLLSMNNYYLDKPDNITIDRYNFDIPSAYDFKSFNQSLEDLKEELPIQLPNYDFLQGKRISFTKIYPKDYLIIDGMYSLMHAGIRSSLFYSFYIESPPDVVLSRYIQRNFQEYNYSAEYCIQQYFTYVRPAFYTYIVPTRQFASMVVSNDYNSQLDLFIDDFLSKYQF